MAYSQLAETKEKQEMVGEGAGGAGVGTMSNGTGGEKSWVARKRMGFIIEGLPQLSSLLDCCDGIRLSFSDLFMVCQYKHPALASWDTGHLGPCS